MEEYKWTRPSDKAVLDKAAEQDQLKFYPLGVQREYMCNFWSFLALFGYTSRANALVKASILQRRPLNTFFFSKTPNFVKKKKKEGYPPYLQTILFAFQNFDYFFNFFDFCSLC